MQPVNTTPVQPISHLTPVKKKNICRRIIDAICNFVKRIFSCFFKKKKVNTNLLNNFKVINQKLEESKAKEASEISQLEQAAKVAVPKVKKVQAASLVGREFDVKDKSPAHIAGRTLVADIMDEVSKEVMGKHVIPYLPGAKETKDLKEKMVSLDQWISVIQKQISAPLSPYTPDMNDSEDPFLLLFAAVDMARIGHFMIYKKDLNPKEVLKQYIYGSETNEGLKPKIKWLPERSHAYLPVAIDWVVESYTKKVKCSFEDFIEKHKIEYKIDAAAYEKDRSEILVETLALICKQAFDPLQATLENSSGLKEMLDPVQLQESIEEMVYENLHMISGVVTDRIFDLLGQLEVAQVVHKALPIIKGQLDNLPKQKFDEKMTVAEQAKALTDIFLPLQEVNGKQVRSISLIWDKVHVPQMIKGALNTFPQFETTVQNISGCSELPSSIKECIQSVNDRVKLCAVYSAQTIVNATTASTITQVVEKLSDPAYLDELMVTSYLPQTIEKLFETFSVHVLIANLDDEFVTLFSNNAVSNDPESKLYIATKWLELINNKDVGLNSFIPHEAKMFKDHDFTTRFYQQILPVIESVTSELRKNKAALFGEKGDQTDVKAVKKQIIQYFIDLAKAKDDALFKPELANANDMKKDYSALIGSFLNEGDLFKGSFFKTPLNWVANKFGPDVLAELAVKSIPTTEEMLMQSLIKMRGEWSTETDEIVDGKKVLKIDLKKVILEKKILTEAQKAKAAEDVKLELDERLTQLSKLSADFAGMMVKSKAGGMAASVVSKVCGPDALKSAIVRVYGKLFSEKQSNKQIFYPLIGAVLGQFDHAHKELAAKNLKHKKVTAA